MRWSRLKRRAAASGVALVLAGLAPGGEPARAQDDVLGGFVVNGVADAISFVYDQPSAGQIFSPIFEVDAVHAATSLNSGPAGHALASVAWPGAAPANAGPQVGLPVYPVRAEAFSPQGPNDSSYTNMPGSTMRARAQDLATEAVTSMQGVPIPGVLDAGNVLSRARGAVENEVATSEATASLSNVGLLNGAITIESVTTVARATSDGTAAKLSGATTVSGLRIAGQAATVDGQGVSAGGQNVGTAPANQIVQQALAQAGAALFLAAPNDVVQGPAGSRSLGGLILQLSGSGLRRAFDQLPPPMGDEMRRNFPTDQSVIVVLAAVNVGSSATKEDVLAGLIEDVSTSFDADTGGLSFAPTTVLGGTDFGEVPPAISVPASPGGGTRIAQPASATRPSRVQPVDADGVPIALGGLSILAALAVAGGLRRAGDALLAATPVGRCPLEEGAPNG